MNTETPSTKNPPPASHPKKNGNNGSNGHGNGVHAEAAAAEAEAPAGKHPKGLYVLFFTEMWERMSYYGMRALLVYYMIKGLQFQQAEASSIYGIYTGLVYFTPIFGGLLADRVLGYRRTIVLGGTLMMIGHFLMAIETRPFFYAALAFLIAGNGCFKPNISTVVGKLYKQGDGRRDAGFTIFYMGINLGALLSPLVCGTLGEKVGWGWGFGSAGIGMLIGLCTFLMGRRRLEHVNTDKPEAPKSSASVAIDWSAQLKKALPALALGAACLPVGIWYSWALAIAIGVVTWLVGFAVGLWVKGTDRLEAGRVTALLVIAFFNVFFWAAFEQAGNTMALWADVNTLRTVWGWEVPATWFQSVNPVFIIVLAPPISLVWIAMTKWGRDVPTVIKMVLGLIFLGLGFVVMVMAAHAAGSDKGQVSLWWLVAAFFLHTVGELCLSPIGLSLVTKLAPVRLGGMLMGVWFLAVAAGNYIAGWLGTLWEKTSHVAFFEIFVAMSFAAALALLAIYKPVLKKLIAGAA